MLKDSPRPPRKITFTVEDFGSLFHTALRKSCDSLATSLMYNLIHLVKSPAWTVLSENVVDRVSGKDFKDIAEFARACRIAFAKMEWSAAKEKLDKQFKTMDTIEFNALQMCGRLMNQEDWEQSVSYLWDMV